MRFDSQNHLAKDHFIVFAATTYKFIILIKMKNDITTQYILIKIDKIL